MANVGGPCLVAGIVALCLAATFLTIGDSLLQAAFFLVPACYGTAILIRMV